MTKQTAAFRAAIDELVASLPDDFSGRVVVNIAPNGGVKIELSEYFKSSRKPESILTERNPDP